MLLKKSKEQIIRRVFAKTARYIHVVLHLLRVIGTGERGHRCNTHGQRIRRKRPHLSDVEGESVLWERYEFPSRGWGKLLSPNDSDAI